jgi:chaperone required for assembly of F1-ATPase
MRELFEDTAGPPVDPMKSAAPPVQHRKRFYKEAGVVDLRDDDAGGGFAVTLDGKPVRTPAKRSLVAPSLDIAEAIAAEWNAQLDVILPTRMPLTRLANSVIDGVADRTNEVAEDVVKYAGSDLLCYRAAGPEGLVAREGAHWDPVLDWASELLGARFVLAEGVMYVQQSTKVLDAVAAALPADPWSLGALHMATTLTGSTLLALALARGFRDPAAVWAAAHVDEDWNMERWGRDETVLAKRAARFIDLQAAAKVLVS